MDQDSPSDQTRHPATVATATARAAYDSGRTLSYGWRRQQLHALRRLVTENTDAFAEAVASDLGKSRDEYQLTEAAVVLAEVDDALKNLRRWLRSRRVRVPLTLAPARGSIVPQPLGTVLIIGPWNYPVQLILAPLLAALAAGNSAVLKPSELAPATSATLARLIPRYLDRDAVQVVEGDASVSTELLAQRFDHIFYTGNGTVGRIVARAAAENLTPTTLELGGKSPVFVDDTVDVDDAARRIAWGKFMNAGQTCVAPDYVLATPARAQALTVALAAAIRDLYGADPQTSADYGRIVNTRHHDRLTSLLDGVRVDVGGGSDRESRYIQPTVVNGVSPGHPLMRDEIFGPILPIVHVAHAQEAVQFIQRRDKPLALYLFSTNRRVRRLFQTRTSSGGMAIGVPSAHLLAPQLPFGGVGESGMGRYHGRAGFETFSHQRSVLSKPLRPDTFRLVQPPFTAERSRIIEAIATRGKSS